MHHDNKQIYLVTISAVFFILGIYPARAAAQNSFPTPAGVVNIVDRDGTGCCAQLQLVVNDQQTHFYEYGNGYGNGSFQIHKYGSGSVGGPVFTILKTGNVGIGTTNPAEILHLRRDQNAVTQLLVQNATANAAAQVQFRAVTDSALGIFGAYSTATTPYGAVTPGSVFLYGTSPSLVMMADNPTGVIKFATGGSTERARIDQNGNVGIGTTNPGYGLQVEKTNASGGNGWTAFFREPGKNGVLIGSRGSGATTGTITGVLSDLSNIADLSLNPFGGNVGVGTLTPNAAYKLDVVGNINSSGTITGNNIVAKYQDVAEWVPSSEKLAAGTVVVLDSTKSNQVVASTTAYDTRVAGVISTQPGITLGEKTDDKVLVATTGRVRVMVDASKGPINIGDLLVTSDVPGVAMKSEAVNLGGVSIHRPGTIIGKALEPLAKGKGEILMLLSLQ